MSSSPNNGKLFSSTSVSYYPARLLQNDRLLTVNIELKGYRLEM